MACVFLFPGQSSIGPGMIQRAACAHPAARALLDRAVGVLGAGAGAGCLGDAAPATNRDVQVSVFVVSQMYLAALQAEGVAGVASLGLSLGEYSHLVHCGALTFEDAVALVNERGHCYDQAPQGSMVTVLAVDYDTVSQVVNAARARGPIVISNYNTPTQHVIAGADQAVNWAAATLEEEHAAHTAVIERRVPMHSPLMTPVARAFQPALARAHWQRATLDYLPNVTAAPIANPAPADLVASLTRHVHEPVLWQSSMDAAVARHADATFVEVGPGGVLDNMIARSWKRVRHARLDPPAAGDPRRHFAETVEALRA